MSKIEDLMRKICDTPELSYLYEAFEEYEKELKDSAQELKTIIDSTELDNVAKNITMDELAKLSFNTAHQVIQRLNIPTRIRLLNDLDKRLLSLYTATKHYNDAMFGKSMPPKDFLTIMGKIKHLEILQSWLYGID